MRSVLINWCAPYAKDGQPDAGGSARAGPNGRADDPATTPAAAVDHPYRRRQGQVNCSVRSGTTWLEPGMVSGNLPVRQVGPMADRRTGRVRVAGGAARHYRAWRVHRVAQDGRRMVVEPQGGK